MLLAVSSCEIFSIFSPLQPCSHLVAFLLCNIYHVFTQFYPIRRLWNDILTVLRHNELISQRNQHRSDNIDGKTYVTNCNDTTNQSNTSIATTAGINGLLSSETHSSSDHPTPCPSSLSTPSSAQSTHLSSIPLLTPSSHRIQVINLFPEPVHSKQWIEQVFGQDYLHKVPTLLLLLSIASGYFCSYITPMIYVRFY